MGKKALTFGIWHGLLTRMAVHVCVCVCWWGGGGKWGSLCTLGTVRDVCWRGGGGRAHKSRGQPIGKVEKPKTDVLVGVRRPIGCSADDISDYFERQYITGAGIAVLRSVIGQPSPWRDTTPKCQRPFVVRVARRACAFLLFVYVLRARPVDYLKHKVFSPVTCPSDGKFHFIPHHSLSFF
jgi:hypothetical protein